MILIGISPGLMYPDPTRRVFAPKTLCYLENDMASFICNENVIPVLIPSLEYGRLEKLMLNLHGLLLQAGSDMSPGSYSEDFLDQEKWPGDPGRDQLEFKLLELAFRLKLPVLGICRGIQVLNVFLGGTLHQDLDTAGKRNHRDAQLYDRNHHDIVFQKNGLLHDLYGLETAKVNTCHHQGIKDLSSQLNLEAFCPDDGIVEAVAGKNLQDHFVLGTQWHPEFTQTLKGKIIEAEPIQDLFLNACRKYKSLRM